MAIEVYSAWGALVLRYGWFCSHGWWCQRSQLAHMGRQLAQAKSNSAHIGRSYSLQSFKRFWLEGANMNIEKTTFPDVLKIRPKRFEDSRGYFWELYREEEFRTQICDQHFVQDNRSLSWQAGTVRGLHFQRHPNAQGKLVQVLSGAIFDVALDIRPASATFGQWTSVELTEENDIQLWIPAGFAHGFMTLKPRTVVQYKTTAPYRPHDEGGILWNDPDIAIEWPSLGGEVKVSDRDALQPRLRDLPMASLAVAELSA